MTSANDRRQQIAALVDEHGFLSVKDLSEICQVSEMTIRRDLELLDGQQRLQRTFGGAAFLRPRPVDSSLGDRFQFLTKPEGKLVDRVDVLIATSVNPKYDGLFLEQVGKKNIPIIAESLSVQNAETVVAVDNYHAAQDLGRWAGNYAQQHWGGKAVVLDLTYHLVNTQARSRGFLAGLREVIPTAENLLSLNAQSRYEAADQLTRDALTVYPQINIIFTINDILAWGAINACKDLERDADSLIVLPFGLEGDTLKGALLEASYVKAGLAMFPEIVGPTCIEAAILAYQHSPLPGQLVTPYAILTPETLLEWYARGESGWKLRWEVAKARLALPIGFDLTPSQPLAHLPRRIGFIVPFMEHEWYQNLTETMQSHAARFHIEFEIVDVDKNLEDEVDLRRREIARCAADLVSPGEVVLIDGGPLSNYLAEALLEKQSITIITNAMPVFDLLRGNPGIILISTGGAYRTSSQMLVGPTAEGALRELRADKVFLMVAGITFAFGLSHTNISEVTMKQAMIRSAREVILLADHTIFGQESIVQVAPLTVVHKLITDDALPASTRLDLSKLGIQIILANI